MKMSLPKIFTRKNCLLLIALLLAVSLFLPKIVEAKYIIGPDGGGGIPAINEYKQALEEGGVNLQQFSLYNLDFIAKGSVKLLTGIPVLEGERPTGGALGTATRLIAGLYDNPPASSVEYLADIGENLGFTKPAYAQGIGWHALSPILELWKIVRNLAYLFFVVVFVVTGFMIMFRKRIDPQTVIGVQTALPRIIVALILVTFSYAIAGLMVDLMQFGIRLVTALISPQLVAAPPTGERWNIFRLVSNALGQEPELLGIEIEGGWLGAAINYVLEIFQNIGIASAISQLIIAIAIVYTAFKLFFALLARYISILIFTIFGPILLLFGALPARFNAVWFWLRGLFTAILSFPAVYAMLAMGAIITGSQYWEPTVQVGEGMWAPEMLYYVVEDPQFIKNIIGLGIILITPKIPEAIDQIFGVTPSPIAGEVGRTIQAAAARIPFVGGFARG